MTIQGMETTPANLIKIIKQSEDECYLLLPSNIQDNESIRITEGTFMIQLIHGNVAINGYHMQPSDCFPVSVGITNSFVLVETSHASSPDRKAKKVLKKELFGHLIEENLKDFIQECKQYASYPNFVVLKCSKWLTQKVTWIESIVRNPRFFYQKRDGFLKICYSDDNSATAMSKKWQEIIDGQILTRITGTSVILITGLQNSGKSVLIQYMINRLLSTASLRTPGQDGIIYMDCDPGQSQLSAPGLLTATFIPYKDTCPLFSSAFVNSLQFNDSHVIYSTSVGSTNPGQDPDTYSSCLKAIWQKVVQFQGGKRPVFINTMGWLTGMGSHLLADVYNITRANILIQIVSKSNMSSRNGFYDCTMGQGWLTPQVSHNPPCFKIRLEQNTKVSKGGGSKQNRMLQQLAYCTKINGSLVTCFRNWHSIKVDLDKVHFHVVYKTEILAFDVIADSLDYSWVHLLAVAESNLPPRNDQTPIQILPSIQDNECLGSGILLVAKDKDARIKSIKVLSPVSRDNMQRVNCILKPDGISIPLTLLKEMQDWYHTDPVKQGVRGQNDCPPMDYSQT